MLPVLVPSLSFVHYYYVIAPSTRNSEMTIVVMHLSSYSVTNEENLYRLGPRCSDVDTLLFVHCAALLCST